VISNAGVLIMERESIFARHLWFLEERVARDETPWESLASLKRDDPDADPDDPVVQVLRSGWGREHPSRAAKLTAAIEYIDRRDMLELHLRNGVGLERACELALAGSKLSAAEVVRDDFDPRDKEFDDFKTREMETEERYW
jgi:hypothetical protein